MNPRQTLLRLFDSTVKCGLPQHCLPPVLADISNRKLHVIGAGKAASSMASTIENNINNQITGIVITRHGHSVKCNSIEVVEASHPIPDSTSAKATKRILQSLEPLSSDTLVLCLISGGASALLSLPHPAISMEEKQSIVLQLLKSGASIHEMNCVRKHLSAVKGGKLMQKIAPRHALTICISDVIGDDPSVIGSGPTVYDSTTCFEALEILTRYNIKFSKKTYSLLESGELETPKLGHSAFEQSRIIIAASPNDCLVASANTAEKLGLKVVALNHEVEGDTNLAAKKHAQQIRKLIVKRTDDKPFVVLSGGETTVNVTGPGQGGPNTQFALALALELRDTDNIYAIACDTDGIDGTQDNAGALITPTTISRAWVKGLDPEQHLKSNDSYKFFEQIDDLVITGPTLTNVNDFRAVLWYKSD